MNDSLALLPACVAGVFLGTLYFGGLWWTIDRGVSSARPALWFLSSTPLRLGLALAGFWYVGHGHWQRMLACLLGFTLALPLVGWLTRRRGGSANRAARGV